MPDYSQYIENILKKNKKEKKEKQILFKKLHKEALIAAEQLGKKFQLEKVYIFGSLTDENKFHKYSDIDFAVTGLKSEEYLAAWGELEKLLDHPFDLVRLEKAHKSLKEVIREDGVLLYESGRDQC